MKDKKHTENIKDKKYFLCILYELMILIKLNYQKFDFQYKVKLSC